MTDAKELSLTNETAIGNTHFRLGFVLEKLRAAGHTECTVNALKSFETKDITGGAAFFSQIFAVRFHWKRDVSPASVVLKIPTLGNALNHIKKGAAVDEVQSRRLETKFAEHLERSHKLEATVYTYFSRSSEHLKLPKFYFGHPYAPNDDNGIIIMEDLTPRATTVKMIPGFTNEQVESVVDEMAKFHAVALRDKSWFEPLAAVLEKENDFLDDVRDIVKQLAKISPARFEHLMPGLLEFVSQKAANECFYKEAKFGFEPFLVHGDLWSSNVLFLMDDKKAPTDEVAAIIDWQMSRPGNPGTDLGRLLGLNTSGSYRRANTERILQRYLDKLGENLAGQVPCTFQQLKTAYNHSLGFVTVFIAYGVSSYHSMESVVGSPPNVTTRNELLDRCQMLIEDMLALSHN